MTVLVALGISDAQGRVNLAPYSFFNLVCETPPIVYFSSKGRKDSLRNAEATGEFVANLVTQDLAFAMNQTAAEVATDIDEVQRRIHRAFAIGKQYCLVVVAEGDEVGGAFEVARRCGEGLGSLSHRVTTLGHVQRGGPPSMRDRILAAR